MSLRSGGKKIINHGKTFWAMNVFVSEAFWDTPPSHWDNYANISGHRRRFTETDSINQTTFTIIMAQLCVIV